MAWTIEYTATARKQLRKLDRQIAKRIVDYLDRRVATAKSPQTHGKALTGPLGDLWRYRVGDYRIMVELRNEVFTVLVVRVGHRGDIYR